MRFLAFTNSFILLLAFFQQALCQYGNTGGMTSGGGSSCPCQNGNCQFNPATSGMSCLCNSGYTGQICDTPIPQVNPCSPNPCYNFGVCNSNDGVTFKCTCSPSYTGVRCERQLTQQVTYPNLCQNNPCMNGGTCQAQSNNYVCVCPNTCTGQRCETVLPQNQPAQTPNPCLSNPCGQGSTCLFNIQNVMNPLFICVCAPNFTGQLCNQPIINNQITNQPSNNNYGQPIFTPAPVVQNACASSPCLSGGTCVPVNQPNINPPYACICPVQYTGLRCEQLVQQPPTQPPTQPPQTVCSQNICLNGGSCQVSNSYGGTSYICACLVQYTGVRCEMLVQQTTQAPVIQSPCSQNPCQNGGTCQASNLYASTAFVCLCQINYTGTRCEIYVAPTTTQPPNPCAQNPCLNGGNCQPSMYGGSSYTCLCQINYTGTRCEIYVAPTTTQPPNPCFSSPCLSGGTCVPINQPNINPPYACVCPPSYTGQRCENYLPPTTTQPPNPCAQNPCLNGGNCQPSMYGGSSYTCLCQINYTGTRCENYLPPTTTQPPQNNACLSNPCNYGRCLPITQPSSVAYVCVCNPGYTGLNCNQVIAPVTQSPITYPPYTQQPYTQPPYTQQPYTQPPIVQNPCASNPCNYGSTCVAINKPNVQPYACLCPINYTGQRCETLLQYSNPVVTLPPPSPCNSNPCSFGGTCVPQYNTFTCICPPSCTGRTCDQMIPTPPPSPCLSNPCQSGGTCISSSYGYSCQCPVGYIGNRCEQRQFVDLCNVNSCYNGGTCQTQSRGQDQYTVVCFCASGYTGSRCQSPLTMTQPTYAPPVYTNPYQPQPQQPQQPTCTCFNNGVCNPDGTCRCQPNFYGSRCEYQNVYQPTTVVTPQNTCPPGLCVEGRCAQAPQSGTFYCICNLGWTGTRCTVRNYCQAYTAVCKNGGTCINNQNGFSCACANGFTGTYCENGRVPNQPIMPSFPSQPSNPYQMQPSMNQNQCSQNICQNGGSCSMTNGQPRCQCQRGYIGLNCEIDICKQPCLAGPCFQSVTRYFYNSQTRQCQTFTYGGCNGNENNFGTLESCMLNCQGH